MFDPVGVVADDRRGLAVTVPPAPRDDLAALACYLVGADTGAERALLGALGGHRDLVETTVRDGVLTLTAVAPVDRLVALADVLTIVLPSIRERGDDPGHAPPPAGAASLDDALRAALLAPAPAPGPDVPGPVVVAVTDAGDLARRVVGLLDAWPGGHDERRRAPAALRPHAPRLPSPGPLAGGRADADGAAYVESGFACVAVPRDDPRYRATALAALHLAEVDGPVAARLRHRDAAVYTVRARVHPERGHGWLGLHAVARAGARAGETFAGEVARLAHEPPPAHRIEALRVRMLTRIARSLADNRGRCSDVVSGVLHGLPLDHHLGIRDGVLRTSRDDVVAAVEALDLSRVVLHEIPLEEAS